MPITPTYPGVYIEELPSGVRTITGVATSITAFIGRAKRGPVNMPKMINNPGDYERIFGGLWIHSPVSYAVQDFYQNGGSQAIIVRLFRPTEAMAEAAQDAADAVAGAVTTGPSSIADAKTAAVAEADKYRDEDDYIHQAALSVSAAVENSQNNLDNAKAAAVTAKDAAVPLTKAQLTAVPLSATVAAAAKAASVAVEAAVTAVTTDLADAITDATAEAETYQDEDQIVYDAANRVLVAVEGADDLPLAKTAATAAKNAVATDIDALLATSGLKLEAAEQGSWGNRLRVRVDYDVPDELKDTAFNLLILDGDSGTRETIRNVSVEADFPRRVDKVLENESLLIRVSGGLPALRPAKNNDLAPGADPFEDTTSTGVLNPGEAGDGEGLKTQDYEGSQLQKTGMFALEHSDLFNLMCIPPYRLDQDVATSLWSKAAKYCQDRRAFLLVDAPSKWTSKDHAKSSLGSDIALVHNHAAIFFPRLRKPNSLRDYQIETFAPCGAVAGLFARTDSNRGVWKAPAGLDAVLRGVLALSVPLTDPENGELNPLGINCLRSKPPAGRLVWGARTLQGDDRLASQWKYIPIRRLALMIEESLYRGSQWVVFEPNDEPLWAQIRLNLGAFMHNLFRQGAFEGKSPAEAYFVKCDKETTIPNDVNLGIVNIVVGFAPLKPAEFVIIKIQQIARAAAA